MSGITVVGTDVIVAVGTDDGNDWQGILNSPQLRRDDAELSVDKRVSVWIEKGGEGVELPSKEQQEKQQEEKSAGHWKKGVVSFITVASEVTVTVRTEDDEWSGPIDAPELLPVMENRGITVKHLTEFSRLCRERIRKENILDPRTHLDRERKTVNPQHGRLLDFDTTPTWLVVDLFVKPTSLYRFGSTPEIRRRPVPFVDLLSDVFPQHGGRGGPQRATHFASHSWSSRFADLVAAFADLEPTASVWICCFAMTQDAERLELVDDDEVFAEALRQKHVQHVLVCDDRMQALTRMWVLFEILRSVNYEKVLRLRPLGVVMNVADFTKDNRCAVQMSHTGCVRKHDEDYIRKEMEEVGGVNALNKLVREGMIKAFKSGIEEASEDAVKGTEGALRLQALLGMAYVDQGRFGDAAHELRNALEGVEHLDKTLQPHSISGVEITNWAVTLGKALSLGGNHEESIVVMKEAIDKEDKWMKSRLSENTLNLVEILRRSSQFDRASEELRKAMAYCGSDPRQSANSKLKLGQQLSHYNWEHVKAEVQFRHVLEAHVKDPELGEDHLKTAKTEYNLAMSVRRQHRTGEAEDMYRNVLKVQKQYLQSTHLDILNSRTNIGITLTHQGDFEGAVAELENVVDLHKSVNKQQPKLAIALVSLGDAKRLRGDFEAAIGHYEEALCIYRGGNNKNWNEIAWACTNLAFALIPLQKWDEVRNNLEQALRHNQQIFGDQHLSVAMVLAHMGTVSRLLTDFDSAMTRYREAERIYRKFEAGEETGSEYLEGVPWISKHIELCKRRSDFLLPSPVEVLALSKFGRCNDVVDWKNIFDDFCERR